MKVLLITAIFIIALPSVAVKAEADQTSDIYKLSLEELLNIRVSSRLPGKLKEHPSSISVISSKEIELQSSVSSDLGVILANTVPGLAPSTMTSTNRSTTLRGRKPAILIDGISIDSPLHSGDQALRAIDVSTIDSIEVIRGASTLYGAGGSGGSINYITKEAGSEKRELSTELNYGSSLTHFDSSSRGSVLQSIAVNEEQFAYYGSVFYEQTDGMYDADGDRLPTQAAGTASIGLAYQETVNVFAKVNYSLDDNKSLSLSGLYYDRAMEDQYELVKGSVASGDKTTDVRQLAPAGTEDPGIEHTLINAIFRQQGVLDGVLKAQLYFQNYTNIFGYFIDASGLSRPTDMVGQTTISSEKIGAKLDFNTPLKWHDMSLLWGVDLLQDKTEQSLLAGSVFDKWVPQLTMRQIAPFAQLYIPLYDNRLHINVGIRHESSEIGVNDASLPFGARMTGGSVDFDNNAFNVGIIYTYSNEIELFSSLSEGYEVAAIGRAIRNRTDDFEFESLNPQAVDNQSLDAGLRLDAGNFYFAFTVYQSRSKLGLQLTGVETDTELRPEQSKERINGVELVTDYTISDRLTSGGSISWLEGRRNVDDGKEYLNGERIPPLKVTAYSDFEFNSDWQIRFQMLYSGNRDRFDDELIPVQLEGEVKSYVTVDFLSKSTVGPGDLTFAISNLFNEDYFTAYSQASNRDDRFIKGPGRRLSLRYVLRY